MLKKLPYKMTIFLTLILSQSLHGAASAPERKIETEAELHAAFARQQTSVRKGLAPLALGGHGPLNIVFAYLQWDKSKPDMVNNSLSQEVSRYVMAHEEEGFYRSTIKGKIEFHSTRNNNPSGVIYDSPSSFSIRTICLQDGRLAALLTDHKQYHIMTLCPRTHVAVQGPNTAIRFTTDYIRQSGNYLLMNIYDTCAAFDINHHQPPYMLTCASGDWLLAIRQLDDQVLLLKFKNDDNRIFIRRYDAATLKPIGDRLEIEGSTNLTSPPHIASLGGKELLVQTENSSQVINFETGTPIHPKIATMKSSLITCILPLKNMDNRSARRRGFLIADCLGRIGQLKIDKKSMTFEILTDPKLDYPTHNRLKQISHDQVAQLTAHNLAIWSLRSKTILAKFSNEFLYNRSISGIQNRLIKFHKGSLFVTDWADNVARVSPESDIEMAYNGRRPLTIKPSGAPAMKPTILTIRDASAIPAKKV